MKVFAIQDKKASPPAPKDAFGIERQFQIPAKIAKNYKSSNTLANISDWRAKIILANSAPKGTKIGDWDEIGYVGISLKSNIIVPIARADEHQNGYELIQHLINKSLIPPEQYTTINPYGGYFHGRKEEVEAYKKFREYGGKNILVKPIYDADHIPYSSIDDIVSMENPYARHYSEKREARQHHGISPVGKRILESLKEIMIGCRKQDPSVFGKAISLSETIDQNKYEFMKIMESAYDSTTTAQLMNAEAKQDFSMVEHLLLKWNGVKNSLHNFLRKNVGSGNNIDTRNLEAFWGDPKQALEELTRLGGI